MTDKGGIERCECGAFLRATWVSTGIGGYHNVEPCAACETREAKRQAKIREAQK